MPLMVSQHTLRVQLLMHWHFGMLPFQPTFRSISTLRSVSSDRRRVASDLAYLQPKLSVLKLTRKRAFIHKYKVRYYHTTIYLNPVIFKISCRAKKERFFFPKISVARGSAMSFKKQAFRNLHIKTVVQHTTT